MSLSLRGKQPKPLATSSNPYALTTAEAAQYKEFNAMTEDQKAERLWRDGQNQSIRESAERMREHEAANSSHVQHLSSGGVQVGGGLNPNALVNFKGVEMTVQQAVDIGVYIPEAIGHQTSDINEIEELI